MSQLFKIKFSRWVDWKKCKGFSKVLPWNWKNQKLYFCSILQSIVNIECYDLVENAHDLEQRHRGKEEFDTYFLVFLLLTSHYIGKYRFLKNLLRKKVVQNWIFYRNQKKISGFPENSCFIRFFNIVNCCSKFHKIWNVDHF